MEAIHAFGMTPARGGVTRALWAYIKFVGRILGIKHLALSVNIPTQDRGAGGLCKHSGMPVCRMGMHMDVIEAKGLTKYYVRHGLKSKQTMGIENVDFSIKKGEIFGFLGPNGAGKTTTMRILLDLLRPTRGSATVLGMDARADSMEIHRRVGFIPGEINFYNNMTPRALFAYYEQLKQAPAVRKGELLEIFDVPLDRPIKTFSKGMKQKVAIIQAFMFDPDVVVMDEPTTGLDPLMQQKVYDHLMALRQEGKTIFISTHNIMEAQKVCDRVAIIRNGRIVAIEGVPQLRAKSGKSITVSFHDDVDEQELITDEVKTVTQVKEGFTLHTGSEVQETLRKICMHDIKDITISESSLEDIFMHYYEGEGNV